jgi:hypothetical protein
MGCLICKTQDQDTLAVNLLNNEGENIGKHSGRGLEYVD